MKNLQEKFYRKIQETSLAFVRSEITSILWDARLIGLKGARGRVKYSQKFLGLNI